MTERRSPIRGPATWPLETELRLQQQAVQGLFDPVWFSDAARRGLTHPAIQRHLALESLLENQGAARLSDDAHLLPELARILLDSAAISSAFGGNFHHADLGHLANYGDELVRRRIRAVAKHPSQFLDLLTEITTAGWHQMHHHNVTATEQPGLADLTVEIDGWARHITIECKRITAGASSRRMGDLITRANRQVKASGLGNYGLALVDVTEKVPNLDHLSAEVPASVADLAQDARRATSSHNSALGGVLLIWDEHQLKWPSSGNRMVSLFLHRRSKLVRHRNPVHQLPTDASEVELAFTVMFNIELHRPAS